MPWYKETEPHTITLRVREFGRLRTLSRSRKLCIDNFSTAESVKRNRHSMYGLHKRASETSGLILIVSISVFVLFYLDCLCSSGFFPFLWFISLSWRHSQRMLFATYLVCLSFRAGNSIAGSEEEEEELLLRDKFPLVNSFGHFCFPDLSFCRYWGCNGEEEKERGREGERWRRRR